MSNADDKEYSISRLSKDNLADVAELYQAVYGKAAAADYFPRKYNTAYTGVENIGFIAYNPDKLPVAYYGVVPCFVQFGNEIVLAAQSVDTMTHPQHRYKGMFVELANMTYDLGHKLGIRLVIGFPNQNSYHAGVNKLGFIMTDTMSYFAICVKGLPLESFSKKAGFIKKLYHAYSRFILKKHITPLKGVASSVLSNGFAGLYRDDAYLDYKTFTPTTTITVGDATIWISTRNGFLIGDMEGVDDTNFNAIIAQLKKIGKRLGVPQLQFHCSTGTTLHRLFETICPPKPSYPVLLKDLGCSIPPEKFKFTFADIDIF